MRSFSSRDWGSSPLARGLLVTVVSTVWTGRIIPARAGFTGHRPDGPHRHRDHPRSRGVYSWMADSFAQGVGSSPLARGLRTSYRERMVQARIIPARAGFTLGCAPSRRAIGDHPRSRGVYSSGRSGSSPGPGSSPLARGLPADPLRRAPSSGIIPARAGFTVDHAPTGTVRARIIPARAGFTVGTTVRDDAGRDHPRSRGVYFQSRRRWGARPGIIPARAGFTPEARRPHGTAQDHPRSRGVYGIGLDVGDLLLGSSPLARGLRAVGALGGGQRRIIPARAGFTRPPPGR